MPLKHVNAIVIGAGAGGGVVAKELSEAGLSVVLLERGGWPGFEAHDHDELISQRTTVLGNAFGPDNEHYRRIVVNSNGTTRTVLPSEGGYNNNAACVGSGTVSYGAMAWRFMEKDFRMRSTYGAPEGSTLEDWPISYNDLEPFYEKAEWEIGVSGDMSENPLSPRAAKNTRCRLFRLRGRVNCWGRQRSDWECTRFRYRCCATPFPGAADPRAFAAGTAWGSPARSMPRLEPTIPSFQWRSPQGTVKFAPIVSSPK